jgi:hypothetical protein
MTAERYSATAALTSIRPLSNAALNAGYQAMTRCRRLVSGRMASQHTTVAFSVKSSARSAWSCSGRASAPSSQPSFLLAASLSTCPRKREGAALLKGRPETCGQACPGPLVRRFAGCLPCERGNQLIA